MTQKPKIKKKNKFPIISHLFMFSHNKQTTKKEENSPENNREREKQNLGMLFPIQKQAELDRMAIK